MIPPPQPSEPAFLFVLSEPGKVPEAEFNDWYDNEHLPLRMAAIPEFLTGARYTASDLLKPSYCAAYDIEAVSLFTHSKYTVLREKRSPREAALVANLGALDRRTCVKIDETSLSGAADAKPKFMASIADATEVAGNGREFEEVKGWRRTHRHRCFDSLLVSHGKPPVDNAAPAYVTIHEFDDESYVDTPEWKKASAGMVEVRRWKLYKSIENTAEKV